MHKKQSRLALVTGGVVVALAGLLTVLLTVVGPAQGESPGSAGHEEPAHVEHQGQRDELPANHACLRASRRMAPAAPRHCTGFDARCRAERPSIAARDSGAGGTISVSRT